MSSKGEDLKQTRVEVLLSLEGTKFIRFKGRSMVSSYGTNGFITLTSDWFANLVYEQFGLGVSRSNITDIQHAVEMAAPDWTPYAHFIGFGDGRVWNMQTLDWDDTQLNYVYSTNIIAQEPGSDGYNAALEFLQQLALENPDLVHDYRQAIAPLFMSKRPSGILWFLGDGANGKSALLNALYLCFGRFFASVNTAQLEDGKVLPALNGMMGNIVQEGSESRVEDSGNYKLIGTRQELSVRRLYTQDIVKVSGDFHTIFNANNVPTFADKTGAIRRRTLLIPFPAHFKDDPTFEDRTFTPEFLGGLITLALETTHDIRDQGNKYQWSDATLAVKRQYDSQVNSAEAFIDHLTDMGIRGVYNFTFLEREYQDWCSKEGNIPLSIQTLKRTLTNTLGINNKVVRDGGKTYRRIIFNEAFEAGDNLVWEDGSGYGVSTPREVQIENMPILEGDW